MRNEDYPGRKTQPVGGIRGMRRPAPLPENVGTRPHNDFLVKHEESALATPAFSSVSENADPPSVADEAQLCDIAVDQLVPSKYQPRLYFDEETINELANSIQAIGLIKPVIIRPIDGGKYELVGGERRWRAHKLLGLKSIRAVVRAIDDAAAMILAFADNEGQETLSDYERGRGFRRILDDGDEPSQNAIARRLGVPSSVISRCLKLLELPDYVRVVLDAKPHLISAHYAKEFVDLSKSQPDLLAKAVDFMADGTLSQEQAIRFIKREAAKLSEQHDPVRRTVKVEGVGTLLIDGSAISLKCEKGVDPAEMALKLEDILKGLAKEPNPS